MPLFDPIPSPVENADFAALEWEPLLALVAGFAASPVGRAAILALQPSTDEEWIARQHQLLAKCGCCLRSRFRFRWAGCSIPRSLPPRRRLPAPRWRPRSCRSLRGSPTTWLRGRRLLREPPARIAGKLPGLSELSAALTTSLRPLAESIERKIQPDGSLADDASPELNRIRREQERQQRRHRRKPARGAAQAFGRRLDAGRPDHDSRRPLRHSGARGAEAARLRRDSRRQLVRADGLCGAARDHRAEQRAGAAASKKSRRRFTASLSRSRGRWAATRTALVRGRARAGAGG